jgi:hypothetical protein
VLEFSCKKLFVTTNNHKVVMKFSEYTFPVNIVLFNSVAYLYINGYVLLFCTDDQT